MNFEKLTPDEQNVIYQCLKATVEGPFFPDWEFSILFGLKRDEVAELVKVWSNVDHTSKLVQVAINNSLNNLLGYPHKRFDIWNDYISVSPSELADLFRKYRDDNSFESSSRGYFNRLM